MLECLWLRARQEVLSSSNAISGVIFCSRARTFNILKDATTTGTARINVGVRQVVAVIHKTSLEGEKMGH